MEWVYDSPFTKEEQDAYLGLKKELKKDYIAKNTVKILSLILFLRKQKFRSAEEIQQSAFFDKEKTKPIFDTKTAKRVFQKLKQKGGNAGKNFEFTDQFIKDFLAYIIPEFIQNPVVNIHETLLKNPTENIKNWVPILKLASNVLHSGTSIAANNVSAVGEGIGGPIGATVVAPLIALVSVPSTMLASAEGNLGQLAATLLATIPVAGDPAANALKQMESMIQAAIDSGSDLVLIIPYVGPYIQRKREEKRYSGYDRISRATSGGRRQTVQHRVKRFSTQRHKYTKWQKTRRNKSAKV
jgi:hypothetical protein